MMGRPFKDTAKKNTVYQLRLNTEDKNIAREKASKKGFKYLSDYILYLIKNDEPKDLKK